MQSLDAPKPASGPTQEEPQGTQDPKLAPTATPGLRLWGRDGRRFSAGTLGGSVGGQDPPHTHHGQFLTVRGSSGVPPCNETASLAGLLRKHKAKQLSQKGEKRSPPATWRIGTEWKKTACSWCKATSGGHLPPRGLPTGSQVAVPETLWPLTGISSRKTGHFWLKQPCSGFKPVHGERPSQTHTHRGNPKSHNLSFF